MSVVCQYCNKTISNKNNLKKHQLTKSCQLTRTDISEIINNNKYKCQYCNKSFNTKKRLENHNSKCDKISEYFNKDKIIIEKDKIIESQKLECMKN